MDDFEKVLPKLVNMQLFADFDAENEEDRRILRTVYDHFSVKKFKAGTVIIKEGDEGDLFYILYKGSVGVSRDTLSGDKIALANLNDSQHIFFGETALVGDGDIRTATVTATTDCETVVLASGDFEKLCKEEPLFGCRVLSVLARRMSKTIRDMNRDKAILYEALCNEIEMGA